MSGNLKWGTKPTHMTVFNPGLFLNAPARKACTTAWVEDVNKRQVERDAKRAAAKAKEQPNFQDKRCKYPREKVVCAKVWYNEAGLHPAYISRRLNVPETTINQWVTELTHVKVKPTPEEVALYLSQL